MLTMIINVMSSYKSQGESTFRVTCLLWILFLWTEQFMSVIYLILPRLGHSKICFHLRRAEQKHWFQCFTQPIGKNEIWSASMRWGLQRKFRNRAKHKVVAFFCIYAKPLISAVDLFEFVLNIVASTKI